MISFDIGYATDMGNKRKVNQDSIMIFEMDNIALLLIADGMGGMSDGEKVSWIAAKEMKLWIEKNKNMVMSVSEDMLVDILFEEINNINYSIIDYRCKNNVKAGTTLTVFLIRNNIGIFAYSGDSRLYQIKNNMIKQLTEDETLYSYNEKNNAEDNSEKNKSILMSYIGKSENLALNIQKISVSKNDIYVLCTDGFYNYLNIYDNENNEIIKCLSAQECTDILIKKVKQSRALDNLSVIIVKCK